MMYLQGSCTADEVSRMMCIKHVICINRQSSVLQDARQQIDQNHAVWSGQGPKPMGSAWKTWNDVVSSDFHMLDVNRPFVMSRTSRPGGTGPHTSSTCAGTCNHSKLIFICVSAGSLHNKYSQQRGHLRSCLAWYHSVYSVESISNNRSVRTWIQDFTGTSFSLLTALVYNLKSHQLQRQLIFLVFLLSKIARPQILLWCKIILLHPHFFQSSKRDVAPGSSWLCGRSHCFAFFHHSQCLLLFYMHCCNHMRSILQ